MNKVITLVLAILSPITLAVIPEGCGEFENLEGIAKLTESECNESGCSVSIKAPLDYQSYELAGFTLLAGTATKPELSALLRHEKHGAYGSLTIIGSPEFLGQYMVWAYYKGNGICGIHSGVKLKT